MLKNNPQRSTMTNKIRKIERKDISIRKKDAEQELAKAVSRMGKLPDECSACKKPFDKKSKEMAQSWIVVARYEQNSLSLFCSECIEKVKEILPDEDKEA